jgi:hypothetical protein
MAICVVPREIEDEAVVRLNLLVTTDAWKNHLGSAAESSEIVMAYRTNGDQTPTLNCARVETEGSSGHDIAEAHQLGISAVVLDDPDRPWERTHKRRDGLRSNRRVSAICSQNCNSTVFDPGSSQTLDHDRKHLGEAGLPGRVRHDNGHRTAPTCNFDQGGAGERLIEGS